MVWAVKRRNRPRHFHTLVKILRDQRTPVVRLLGEPPCDPNQSSAPSVIDYNRLMPGEAKNHPLLLRKRTHCYQGGGVSSKIWIMGRNFSPPPPPPPPPRHLNNERSQIFFSFLVRYNVIFKAVIKYVVNSSCRSGQIYSPTHECSQCPSMIGTIASNYLTSSHFLKVLCNGSFLDNHICVINYKRTTLNITSV